MQNETIFDNLVRTYGLTEEQQKRAWESLRKLRVGPDDVEATRVVLHHIIEADVNLFARAITAAMDKGSKEAKSIIANAARMTDQVVKSGSSILATMQAETVQRTMTQVQETIISTSERVLQQQLRAVIRRTVVGATLGVVVLTAVASGVTGYLVHSADQAHAVGSASRLEAMLTAADADQMADLLQLNGSIPAIVRSQCADGSRQRFQAQGREACEIALALTPAAQPRPR